MNKNDTPLHPLNGDDNEEQKRQGLTSVGIKKAAHQASGGVGDRAEPGSPISGG